MIGKLIPYVQSNFVAFQQVEIFVTKKLNDYLFN